MGKPNKNKFQEYSEEFRDIGGVKGKGKAQLPEGAITLINQRIVTDDLPVIPFSKKKNSRKKRENDSFVFSLSKLARCCWHAYSLLTHLDASLFLSLSLFFSSSRIFPCIMHLQHRLNPLESARICSNPL